MGAHHRCDQRIHRSGGIEKATRAGEAGHDGPMLLSLMAATVTPAPDQSVGDRLLPVVIGALVALAGSFFVQLWLIPRVDTRKRREQRWEEDVLALGQLLTFEHPSVVSGLRVALHALGWIAEAAGEMDGDRWAAVHAQERENLRAANQAFNALRVRIDWLSDRVTSLAPGNPELEKFGELSRRYYLRHATLTLLEWRPDLDDKVPTTEEINEVGEALEAVTIEIVTALKAMLAGRPPRNPAIRNGAREK